MQSQSSTTPSILQDGRIKPGIYKILNIVGRTCVDIKDDVRQLCGRPFYALAGSRGQWEILPLGPGYTIRKAGTAASKKPDEFCIMLEGTKDESVISVSEFPVAWKIAVVDDAMYSGFEYVRIFWGSTNMAWDLAQWGSNRDGTRVRVMEDNEFQAYRVWELIPVKVDNFTPQQTSRSRIDSFVSPPYDEEREENHCRTCSCVATKPEEEFSFFYLGDKN